MKLRVVDKWTGPLGKNELLGKSPHAEERVGTLSLPQPQGLKTLQLALHISHERFGFGIIYSLKSSCSLK